MTMRRAGLCARWYIRGLATLHVTGLTGAIWQILRKFKFVGVTAYSRELGFHLYSSNSRENQTRPTGAIWQILRKFKFVGLTKFG